MLYRYWVVVLFCFAASEAKTQLCTGSLGDPVVNITFGTGISSGTSYTPPGAYTFTSNSCPNDGFYTVTDKTQNCFGNTWHSVSSDHTGTGNFMLVNASFTPGDFFRASVSELCPNTTYEFAAWAMNVMRVSGINPDLTFRIEKQDGTLLGQFDTGPLSGSSSPLWQQYGFFFTTPPDNPVVILRITNNAPGGIGNDLALDDITFRPCGAQVTATIDGMPGEINLCVNENNNFSFSADAGPSYVNPAYQWQLSRDSGTTWNDVVGATAATYVRQPTGSGHYWYRFGVTETGSQVNCRIISNTLVINVWPKPLADAGPDRVLLAGDTIRLKGNTGINTSYNWEPAQYLSDNTVTDPFSFPPHAMAYKLSVLSVHGCTNEDWVHITVVDNIYIPTAFTPNNDGINDHWRIPYIDPEWGAHVKLYNRYGQLVYEGEGASIRWDGTFRTVPQSTGVYVYMLTLRAVGITRKGTITLIR